MSKNNVLDMTVRIKEKKSSKSPSHEEILNNSPETPNGQVLNLLDHKTEKTDSERRRVTRTVLSQFVGVFAVVGDGVLQPVHIHDISTSGLGFDMAKEAGAFNLDESVTLRIYISHDTYFSFMAKVVNVREVPGQGVVRHGASYKKTAHTAEEALYHFVRFLETVSSTAKKDKGEKVSGRVD